MPGIIKQSDVSEKDIYGDIRKSAADTIPVINELNQELVESAAILEKDVTAAQNKNTKSINAFVAAAQKAEKMKKRAVDLDKKEATAIKQKATAEINLERIKREKLKTEREELRNSQLLKKQKDMEAKASERVAKAAREENNAYKILSDTTRDQKNESKRLAAEMLKLEQNGKRLTPEYRKMAATYRDVTRAAQKGDKALKKIDATVGDNFRSVGDYNKGLEGLKRGLLRIGAALGVFRALRGTVDIVKNFDQAQGDLLAISGKTEDQLTTLTKQAKELGAVTQFSATQITEMQIELAKLGFETSEIQKSTKAISNFAAATGAAIPEAAALAGSALRAFGLGAEEMERVVSTLGVATTKTALDFNALNSGLSTVAPVAKAFGFSIEDTTALLGQLANSGFDASSAATATRNILLNLADANGVLAKELGRPITSSEELAGALQELQAKGIDLGKALELTDKRSVAAFNTFIEGSDSLVDLKQSITGVNAELEEMAAKRLDTIGGQFTLLSSAWEGFILKMNEGGGIGENVKEFLTFLAENLDEIASLVITVGKAFLIYKTRLLAIKAINSPFIRQLGQFTRGLGQVLKGAKGAGSAFKGMGKQLRAVGWTAVIAAVAKLAQMFWKAVSGARALARETFKIGAATDSAIKDAGEKIDELNKIQEKRISQLERERALNKITQAEFIQQKEEAVKATEDQLKNHLKAVGKRRNANREAWEEQKNLLERLGVGNVDFDFNTVVGSEFMESLGVAGALTTDFQDRVFKAVKGLENLRAKITASDEKIKIYTQALEEAGEATKDATVATKVFSTEVEVAGEKAETAFSNQIELLRELNAQLQTSLEIRQELSEAQSDQEIQDVQDLIDAEVELQKIKASEGGVADFSKAKELINRRKDIEIKAAIARRDFEIKVQKDLFKLRFDDMRAELALERDELLAQDNLTKADRILIEENYQVELGKIKAIEVDAYQNLQGQIVNIKEVTNNEILGIERDTNQEIKELDDQALKDKEDKLKDLEDLEKEAAKRRREIAILVTKFLDKQSDKRIAALDREIAAAENRQAHFQQLAEDGNINTEQSLAEQQRIINEANKKKIAEEQAKARRALILAGINTYNSKVEQGSKTPLVDTARDIALLQALINSIPAFAEGIENTGANGQGLDGRGGSLAMIHPYERIMDAENNSKVPAWMSNSTLAQVAQDVETGKLVKAGTGAVQIGGMWDTSGIEGKLDELINKPETEYNLEQITEKVFMMIKATKTPNGVLYNRHRHD